MNIRISADSTCDLSGEVLARYNIGVTPLYIVMGDEVRRDGECTPEDIFAHVESTGRLCSTSAVTIADYQDWFSAQLQRYEQVVHLTISAEMSSCYQNACAAATDFPGKVFVVDARSLSTGIGQLAVEGALLAGQGLGGQEIAHELERYREKLNVSFVLDTLDYIYKGGRCSGVAALGANLLKLKPCIELKGGVMGVGKKYRGTLERAVHAYVSDRMSELDTVDPRRIFITHTVQDEALPRAVAAQLAALDYFEEIIETRAGGTVANHCGPGCLGILFYNK